MFIILVFIFFQKCVGAINGTYINAWAPASNKVSYRNRKATIAHNIMCACDFDLKFTFVYTGWEGIANDSRIFLDAMQRPENNFPWPPPGNILLPYLHIYSFQV